MTGDDDAGDAEKAVRVCEKVISANPDAAYLGEMAPAYWQALLKLDRVSKVEDLLTKAIKSGDRKASAHALIARGDVIRASGDTTGGGGDANAASTVRADARRRSSMIRSITDSS